MIRKHHVVHYLVLLAILASGVVMFLYENGDHSAQLAVAIVTSFAYVLWGIIHHSLQEDLHRKIVVEYVLMGMIAVMLFLIVLSP